LIRKYVGLGEIAFRHLAQELDEGTFGALYERLHVNGARGIVMLRCGLPNCRKGKHAASLPGGMKFACTDTLPATPAAAKQISS